MRGERQEEKIFLDNVAKVDAHNANVPKGGMVMKVGKFADMTEEEFERQHVAYERRAHKQRRVSTSTAELGRSAKRVVEENRRKKRWRRNQNNRGGGGLELAPSVRLRSLHRRRRLPDAAASRAPQDANVRRDRPSRKW